MNELQLKQALQVFLAANTVFLWDTSDGSFVNIYEGELHGLDSVVTKRSKQKLSIELRIKLSSVNSLNTLDNNILGAKIVIDELVKTIQTRTDLNQPLKSLKFEGWQKEIETSAVSDKQIQYQASLSMFFSIVLQGF